MSARKVSRSRCAPALTGDVLPPLPSIPKPRETEAERRHRLALEAETLRLLREIRENQIETNLRRAVKLVHMAYRREGPLIDYFTDLGFKWGDLADSERMPKLLGGRAAE